MGAQNIIELGFNIDELTAEKKQVLDLFVDLFGKLQEYDGTKFNPLGNGGLADLKKSLTDGAQAMSAFTQTAQKYNEVVTQQAQKQAAGKKTTDDLGAAMKEYQRILDQLTATQAKNNAASSDAAAGLAVEKQALKERNAELSASAALQLAEANSTGEAKAAIKALTIEKDHLNLSTEEGKQRLEEINAELDKNTQFLKENGSEAEKQKMNIGNYAESLAPAFASAQEQLENINRQMAAMEQKAQAQNFGRTIVSGFAANQQQNQGPTAFAGGTPNLGPVLAEDADGYAKLAVQGKIYENLLERQKIGFSNVNQEMRAVKNTLDALELAGGKNTETFEKLNTAYTTSEQKVKDLHKEQAILESDVPALTALTGVAKGLGGAYALGAGAAGLFADGNEKVEKELTKLVAVMTFLQGLEEALSALKERNAIVTALEEESIKALNFVKSVEVRLFGESKIAQAAETAATVENTEAAVANTEATVAEGAAMETTQGAAVGLRTALVGLGIGAIIIAVGVLVAKIVEWSEAENKAAETSAELAEAMEKVNEILLERIRLSDEDAEHTKKNLENAQQLAEKNKQAYNDIYSVKKATADLDSETAQHDLLKAANTKDVGEAYRVIDGQVKGLTASMGPLLKKQEELVDIGNIWQEKQRGAINQGEAYLKIYQKYGVSTSAEDAKNQLENVQKQIDATKKVIDGKKKLTDAYDQSQVNQSALAIEKIQHDAEEERKIALSTAATEADLIKSKNQIILNDDRSTLAQRLDVIKSNASQEKAIIEAGLKEQLSRPDAKDSHGNLTADSQVAIQKAAEDEKKITISTQAEIYKTIVDWNDKKLQFLNDISKNELEGDAAIQEAISKNDTKQLDVRLSALQKNIDDRTQVIAGDYSLQLKLAIEHNKTQEEFDKIESDRTRALAELTANVQKEIYDITLSWGEKRLKAIQDQSKAQNSVNDVSSKYNAESDALDKSLSLNLISIVTYNEKRKKLDEQYAIDKADAQVKDDQKELQELKSFQEKTLDLQAAFANSQLELAKATGDSDKIAKAQAEADAITKVQQEGQAAITDAIKKSNDDQDAANKTHNAKTVAAAGNVKNILNELASKTEEFATSLVQDSYEKRIQSLERQTELQDAASEEEITAVQRSTLSQRQAAEEETILAAQKTARDTAAKKQERADKIAEAKYDRDIAVAQIIWSTAAAILRTYEEYGFTPLGIAAEAALAAIGAIEVATVLSKPLPSYAEGIGIPGRGRHPGGEAIVGEAGPELVSIPGRDPFVVDKATLIDLAPDSKVQPLNKGIISDLGDIGMMRGFAILNAHTAKDNAVERAINNQTTRLERALKRNQRKIINHIVIPSDTAGLPREYYNTKILGKK